MQKFALFLIYQTLFFTIRVSQKFLFSIYPARWVNTKQRRRIKLKKIRRYEHRAMKKESEVNVKNYFATFSSEELYIGKNMNDSLFFL